MVCVLLMQFKDSLIGVPLPHMPIISLLHCLSYFPLQTFSLLFPSTTIIYHLVLVSVVYSKFLRDFDPFEEQKKNSFRASMEQIKSVGQFLSKLGDSSDSSLSKLKLEFEHLVLVRCGQGSFRAAPPPPNY